MRFELTTTIFIKFILCPLLCCVTLYGKSQSDWQEIGSGANALNADSVINSLALDNKGNIYAAGLFRNTNKKQYIAHWDGNSWQQLGNFEANGFVYDLQTDKNGNLYSGGKFNNPSGYCYVAKWDGSSWSELGSLNADEAINRITIDPQGNVYAAGAFATRYPVPHCYVAKWDGTNWSELGGGLSTPFISGYFIPVATDSLGNIYAGGTGRFAASTTRGFVAKWNGSAWSNMGLVVNNSIIQFAINIMGEIYAIGYFTNSKNKNYVARWDGNTWAEVGELNANASINSITTDPAGNLYVVGNFTNAEGKRYVAKWDGVAWSELGHLNGNNIIYRVISDAKGNIYTAGKFTNANGKQYVAVYPAEKVVTVDSIKVKTKDNVLPQVVKEKDTLALEALVFPQTANQHVIWSIVPITGTATISTAGLILGKNTGTVWAKAVSVTDRTKMDSILIHIIGIDSVKVQTKNNVLPIISQDKGMLELIANVFPNTAPQNVNWHIVPITGAAAVSMDGFITASKNGTVWAKATCLADTTKSDSILITITGQIIPIDSIKVHTLNNVAPTIKTENGQLQIIANIFPSNANQSVTWEVIPVSGNADLSTDGLLTAIKNGTAWAKATSQINPAKSDSILIYISGQITPIDSLKVFTKENAPPFITTLGGSLDMVAKIYPPEADQSVTWAAIPITGNATIDNNGTIHALLNGTVWAKAVSVLNHTKSDSLLVTISGQPIKIDSVVIKVLHNGPASITNRNGSLQLIPLVYPLVANQAVTWQILPVTGSATISSAGLVAATNGGSVWAKATAVEDKTKNGSLLISICPYQFKLHLYPNPTKGILNIEVINPCGVVLFDNPPVLKIFNAVGVLFQTIYMKATTAQLHTDKLPADVYFIQYSGGGYETTEKFIKQ